MKTDTEVVQRTWWDNFMDSLGTQMD